MTKNERILRLLESGNRYTAAQLAGMTDTTIKSVHARVSELRRDGFAVYARTRKSDGKTFYSLGRPNRTMVQVAYAVFGAEAFTS